MCSHMATDRVATGACGEGDGGGCSGGGDGAGEDGGGCGGMLLTSSAQQRTACVALELVTQFVTLGGLPFAATLPAVPLTLQLSDVHTLTASNPQPVPFATASSSAVVHSLAPCHVHRVAAALSVASCRHPPSLIDEWAHTWSVAS